MPGHGRRAVWDTSLLECSVDLVGLGQFYCWRREEGQTGTNPHQTGGNCEQLLRDTGTLTLGKPLGGTRLGQGREKVIQESCAIRTNLKAGCTGR